MTPPSTEFWRDPDLPYAESRRACQSRACYRPHSHPTFSIGAVDQGFSLFTGAGPHTRVLRAGTVIFVPPARVHACNPPPGIAWSYQMLHLDAAWLATVRGEYAPTILGAQAVDAPVRVVSTPTVYAAYCRLNTLLFSDASSQDKEAALITFIGDSDTAQGMCIEAPAASAHAAAAVNLALDALRNASEPVMPLCELASLAGMSRYQLIRAFRAATGMTPHAWQLNHRVNLARERIRSGERIADIALSLGFADQAHFQRTFKAYTAVTPGRYRA